MRSVTQAQTARHTPPPPPPRHVWTHHWRPFVGIDQSTVSMMQAVQCFSVRSNTSRPLETASYVCRYRLSSAPVNFRCPEAAKSSPSLPLLPDRILARRMVQWPGYIDFKVTGRSGQQRHGVGENGQQQLRQHWDSRRYRLIRDVRVR